MAHKIPNELIVSTDRRFMSRPAASPEILQMVGVDPEWSEYVRVLDTKGPLKLLHYISVSKSKSDHSVDESPFQHIGHVRGTIVNTETGEIVCRSYPYTPEVVSSDTERITNLLGPINKSRYYRACEGTVIRLFWNDIDANWEMSTHRKIDAMNSYWSGPTFGSMFEEICQFDYSELNKRLCYVLLMSHDGNRLVYKVTQPQLMMVTIYDRDLKRFLDTDEWGTPLKGTILPPIIPDIDNMIDLQTCVDDLETAQRFDMAGVLAITDAKNPQPIKIVNSGYNCIRSARGNDPSLRTRYLQLRGTPSGGILVNWYTEPHYSQVFDAAENEITELAARLHKMYVNRYVNKDFGDLPKEEFVTLQRCHEWHKADRASNIVVRRKVEEILNTRPGNIEQTRYSHYILKMLKRMRDEKKMAAREAKSSDDDNIEYTE